MDEIASQFSFASPEDGPLRRLLIRLIERLTGQPKLLEIYLDNLLNPIPGENFFDAALRRLGLRVQYDAAQLAGVPRTGPLVFVSNHPYGVLDGLVACALAHRARPDFKILVNAILTRPPEMAAYSLPIDFRDLPEAIETNLRTRAEARKHLAEGGALLIFPSGTVSTRISLFGGPSAADPAWKPFVAQLVQRSGASVVPFYFEGENSWAFHAASHMSLTLRLALLFNEVRSRIGSSMSVKIGDLVSSEALDRIGGRYAVAQYLRALTYRTGGRDIPGQFGPRLARRLGLDMPPPTDEADRFEKLRAAY